MSFEIIPFATGLIQTHTEHEILKCNDYTALFGLTLTRTQAAELAETRSLTLRDYGRIEFGGGAVGKLIKVFCDSPYLSMCNYAETLHELTELFYAYKNESLDLVSDDDLIRFMKTSFDGVCQGSVELLNGRELYRLAKNLRYGIPADTKDDEEEADE